jgi:hypothetical protein
MRASVPQPGVHAKVAATRLLPFAIRALAETDRDNNIFTQIGFVMIGLAAKNAILIVEFAKQYQDTGKRHLPFDRAHILADGQQVVALDMDGGRSVLEVAGLQPHAITRPRANASRAVSMASRSSLHAMWALMRTSLISTTSSGVVACAWATRHMYVACWPWRASRAS